MCACEQIEDGFGIVAEIKVYDPAFLSALDVYKVLSIMLTPHV